MILSLTCLFWQTSVFAKGGRGAGGSQERSHSSKRLGGSSGAGGGTTCAMSDLTVDKRILLDLVTEPRVAADFDFTTDFIDSSGAGQAGVGLEILRADQTKAFVEAVQRLERWLPSEAQGGASSESLKIVNVLKQILGSLRFVKLNCNFGQAIGYELGESNQCIAPRAVVYYFDYSFLFLRVGEWNRLGFNSKVALLIHEVLRMVQSFSLERKSSEDDNKKELLNSGELQALTAKIMQGPTSLRRTLEFSKTLAKLFRQSQDLNSTMNQVAAELQWREQRFLEFQTKVLNSRFEVMSPGSWYPSLMGWLSRLEGRSLLCQPDESL